MHPPKIKVNERKAYKTYVLTTLKDGSYEPLSKEEFDNFLKENTDLVPYF